MSDHGSGIAQGLPRQVSSDRRGASCSGLFPRRERVSDCRGGRCSVLCFLLHVMSSVWPHVGTSLRLLLKVQTSRRGTGQESERGQADSSHESPAPSLSHKSVSYVHESSLDSSCVQWLTQRLRLLFPASSSPLRGSAQSPVEFVDELFDPTKHTLVFEDFLHRTDGLPLFASLTLSRTFNMSTSVPQAGSYSSFMYFVKPLMKEDQEWTSSSLTDNIQVLLECSVAKVCLPQMCDQAVACNDEECLTRSSAYRWALSLGKILFFLFKHPCSPSSHP
jgi:hypothetical protein